MTTIQDILNYLDKTPENTNKAILIQMLNDFGGGGNMEPFIIDVSELEYDTEHNTFIIEAEKGEQAYNLFMQGKAVYACDSDGDVVDYMQMVRAGFYPGGCYLSDSGDNYTIAFERNQ